MRRFQDPKLGDGQIKYSPLVSRILLAAVAAHALNNSVGDLDASRRVKDLPDVDVQNPFDWRARDAERGRFDKQTMINLLFAAERSKGGRLR